MTQDEFQEALWKEIKKQSKNDWFQIDLKQEKQGDEEVLGSIVYNNRCLVIAKSFWNGFCYGLDGDGLRVFDIRNSLFDDEDTFSWDEAFEYLYNDILIADDWGNSLEFKRDENETTSWYVCKVNAVEENSECILGSIASYNNDCFDTSKDYLNSFIRED